MYWGIDIRVIGAVLAGIVLFCAGWFMNGYRWDAKYTALKNTYAEAVIKAKEEVKKRELALQAKADQIRKDRQDAETRLVANYESVIRGLRNRPENRAVNMPSITSTGVGSTGAQLARPDGEFLARYARDAEQLKAAYLECKMKYEAARDVLME